jgi:hypothetical protein
MREGTWNGAKNAFSDGEEGENEGGERSTAAGARARQMAEHYQDMAKSANYILAHTSRCDLRPAQSILKEELHMLTKSQIGHDGFRLEDLETVASQSEMFRARNNVNKNC